MSDKLSQITAALNGGRAQQALAIALQNPPYGQDPSYAAQDIAAVVQVLGQFKDAQMGDALKDLGDDQIDVLINYLYRGMESGQNSSQLFKWFAAVQAKGDIAMGSIVRVLTDKNRF
eukprot:TRINITY_DN3898_c0_g1_i1.p2 TRINITY_DN3898_c0_g1~~TRINITY_DN3898_c0_g1_i1.p2  ORF type:complete len:134 (-),score=45.31 TRINITY_DN3898_c0_g1_i1:1513-1863(-)